MKLLLLLFAISRLCESSLYSDPSYRGVRVGITPYAAPVNSHTAYLAQDNNGHYAYGYASGLSAQDEVRTPDGVTRGGYSYIDANGILQTVQYVSDPVNGFRVAATNLPKDLPEVAAARAQHLAQFEYIKAEHAAIAASRGEAVISPVPHEGYVAPVRQTNVVPVVQQVVPVAYQPVVQISSQYQAQDTLGQYSYGYADPNSAKTETKTADGITRGGYSYIDANGILQTVQYVADPINGFRVAGTNLPQAPSVILIGPKVTATVVGPKETASSISAPVAQTQVPVVGPVSGPILHPNPNHQQIPIVPNSELPPPFYPQYAPASVPVHSQAVLPQQPVYASPIPLDHGPQYGYNIPQPDGGAILPPPHPSQVLTAPDVAPHYRGVLGPIPGQYIPENRGQLYGNPNIQVSESYQGLGQIVVEEPSHPHGQILSANPRSFIVDEDPNAVEPRGPILPAHPGGHIVADGPRGQLVSADPRLVLGHGSQIGQNQYGADQRGHLLISQGPIAPQNPQGQIVPQYPQGQIIAAGPRQYEEDPRGQLLIASQDVQGQIQGQYVEDPRAQFIADSRGQIIAQGPQGQIIANDPRLQQYLEDSRQIAIDQGQILQDVQGRIADQRPQGEIQGQYLLGPAEEGVNYQGQINNQGVNAGPATQQVLNQEGPSRVGLFSPGPGQQVQQVQQVQQAQQGEQGAPFLVRVENEERASEQVENEGVTPNAAYSLNIKY